MPNLALPDHSSLYYLDEDPCASGSGRAVLLLHGLGAACESWTLQIPALVSAGWRVLAADTPGFGRSRAVRPYRSIAEMTAFIPALLDHLGQQQINLVGISMGGVQALQFALASPERVCRLVLANTFARLDLINPRVWPYYLSRLFLVYVRGLPAQAEAVAVRIFPKPDQQALRDELVRQVLMAQPPVYRSAMQALARFNQQARLGKITAPALIITGERDSTVPPAVQGRLAQGINRARHVTIPDAGHAVSVERPEEFNRLVIEFLSEQTDSIPNNFVAARH